MGTSIRTEVPIRSWYLHLTWLADLSGGSRRGIRRVLKLEVPFAQPGYLRNYDTGTLAQRLCTVEIKNRLYTVTSRQTLGCICSYTPPARRRVFQLFEPDDLRSSAEPC